MEETELIERVKENLTKNGFEVHHFTDKDAAADWLCQQVAAGERVGFGGSRTVRQLGLPMKLAAAGVREAGAEQAGDRRAVMIAAMGANAFFCSAVAVTGEGWVFNCDGTGNRVAATIFGPERVYFVVGRNKLVDNLSTAEMRLRRIAPLNCQEINCDTPCVSDGYCSECDSDDRSCRIYVLLKRPPRSVRSIVVLIDEDLGL